MTAPSILVLDDGELDRVQVLLEHLPFDWIRCAEPDSGMPIETPLETPLDLIISSGPRAMKMPPLAGAGRPLWVCIYDPDFLVLRERLCSLGVHYLVSSDLAIPTLERFLRQLLHRGHERRAVRRIPLDCAAQIALGRERRLASLYELSSKSCVVRARGPLSAGDRVSLCLDAELTGESELEIPGSVARSVGAADADDQIMAVVDFAPSDGRAMARLHDLLSGHSLGAPVTPLCIEPNSIAPEPDAASWGLGKDDYYPELPAGERKERRGAMRQPHGRRIEAIRWQGASEPWVVLAKDLSSTGLCITASASAAPKIGGQLSLALYGRSREEPLLVGARVMRVDFDEVGVQFEGLTSGQRRGLDRLLAMSPYVEDLGAAGSSRHVVELRAR